MENLKPNKKAIIKNFKEIRAAVNNFYGPYLFKDEDGITVEAMLHPYVVGCYLMNLEAARDLVGHSTLKSTAYYVHIKDYHWLFLRDLIYREARAVGRGGSDKRK